MTKKGEAQPTMADFAEALGLPGHIAEDLVTPDEALNWLAYGHLHAPIHGPSDYLEMDWLQRNVDHIRQVHVGAHEAAAGMLDAHYRAGTVRLGRLVERADGQGGRTLDLVPPDAGVFAWSEKAGGHGYSVLVRVDDDDDLRPLSNLVVFWRDLLKARPVITYPAAAKVDGISDRPERTRPRSRRGPKTNPKFYPDELVLEAVRIITTDGQPATQAALVDRLLLWCQDNWPDTPGETWVKERVSKVYEVFGFVSDADRLPHPDRNGGRPTIVGR